MSWTLNQKGWPALLTKIALFTAFWQVVAFAFAAESYISARGGPFGISWIDAVGGVFRYWFPWLLLSPAAVILADRFPFDRNAWGRSLILHLAACCLIAVAYEGLLSTTDPMRLAGGMGLMAINDPMPHGMPGFVFSAGEFGPPPPPMLAPSGGPVTVSIRGGRVLTFGSLPAGAPPPPGQVTAFGPSPQFGPERMYVTGGPIGGAAPGAIHLRPENKWKRFVFLTMLGTQFTFPLYWCVAGICWGINHFQEAREHERRTLELETRLTQANLQTLKMQLQPHFLFNSLNAVSSLIHENPDAADDMVGSLSQFLRTTLDVSFENEVALRRELEFVECYLEIQQVRFGERLRILREIDPLAMDAMVPPLILQPLVENAIRYGIEPRETGGSVTIRAAREGEVLRLEISDDGVGFKGGQMPGSGIGVGLSNTKTRLHELYGAKHRFILTANQPAGACVNIEIPFHLAQPNPVI
jgi:two-component sensor histidine kinase